MLPVIEINYFDVVLPFSKKKIHFKPFTVKQQKDFLINKENNKDFDTYDFSYSLVKNCCNEDIDNLILADFNYLFFQIRKQSVGNELNIAFKYTKTKEDDTVEFSQSIDETLKIDEHLKCSTITEIEKKIVFDTVILNLKHITIGDYIKYKNLEDQGYLVSSMLKSVEYKGQSYTDFSIEEAKNYLEMTTEIIYNKVIDFFLDAPRIYFDYNITLSNGNVLSLKDRDFTDFF